MKTSCDDITIAIIKEFLFVGVYGGGGSFSPRIRKVAWSLYHKYTSVSSGMCKGYRFCIRNKWVSVTLWQRRSLVSIRGQCYQGAVPLRVSAPFMLWWNANKVCCIGYTSTPMKRLMEFHHIWLWTCSFSRGHAYVAKGENCQSSISPSRIFCHMVDQSLSYLRVTSSHDVKHNSLNRVGIALVANQNNATILLWKHFVCLSFPGRRADIPDFLNHIFPPFGHFYLLSWLTAVSVLL